MSKVMSVSPDGTIRRVVRDGRLSRLARRRHVVPISAMRRWPRSTGSAGNVIVFSTGTNRYLMRASFIRRRSRGKQ